MCIGPQKIACIVYVDRSLFQFSRISFSLKQRWPTTPGIDIENQSHIHWTCNSVNIQLTHCILGSPMLETRRFDEIIRAGSRASVHITISGGGLDGA